MGTFLLTILFTTLTLGAIGYAADQRARKDLRQKGAALQLLPGDIKYESPSGNFRFYFPLTTSIVLSVVLSILIRLFS
jgi:hypothetical protein